ncbi:MAG: DEAD/DEAH box helicase [Rhabdochlamydiaceae bacterium]|nr:DEAD/DEAH box helicase [Rhabdochlamydiaceae bacterium]
MTEFNSHIEVAEKQGKVFLRIRIEAKEPLTQAVASSNEVLQALIKEELRFQKVPKLPASHIFSHVHISMDRSWEILKKLSLTRKLFWKGQRVLFDPFSSPVLTCEASQISDEQWQITGFWNAGDQFGSLCEAELLMPSDPPWMIKNGVVQRFSGEIDWKWYALVYPKPTILDKNAYREFISDYEDEEKTFVPSLKWTSVPPKSAEVQAEPLPFLVLSDRSGAFADLWFDYSSLGKVNFHDPKPMNWRNKNAEKSWEKDLLETDFISKIVDMTHYYCPLDKVAKSLTFLMEIGWKIVDHLGRNVVRQKGFSVHVDRDQETFFVRGKVCYQEHEADLTDLMGAFNRREQFLTLDSSTIALIDRTQVELQWGELAGREIVAQGIAFKKNQVGVLSSLIEKGVTPHPTLIDWTQKLQGELSVAEAPPSSLFHGTLIPYQQQGVDWLHFLLTWGFGGLLADEMGLGKTVQVLAFFSRLPLEKPALVVMPTSLVFNWLREVERFLPSLIPYLHAGKERSKDPALLQSQKLILTSYALLRQDDELFQSLDFEVVVLDEGQNIKNPDSQIAQILFSLKSQMRLVVTGTPIENRWEDLWSLFRFLMPDLLGERREFTAKMAAATLDPRYLQQTRSKIRPFLLRRRKEQVAQQLPEKINQVVWVEMQEPQRALYEEWVRCQSQGLLKKISLEGALPNRMEILEAILRLRQLCADPRLVDGETLATSAKLERMLCDLEEAIAEKRKVLIYSQFTQMLHLIEKELQERNIAYVYLDGSTKDREQPVSRFQEDPEMQVFLISLKAGGVGLNLTAADYVFLYDPWWNEAAEAQAIDRAHRFGRQGSVIARRYITAYSIEEKLMRLKEHKRSLAEGLLEGELNLSQLTMDDLSALLL